MDEAAQPALDAVGTLPPGAPGLGTLLADKYLLDAVLGIGGMGAVYRARHTALNLAVAVKIILPEFASRPEFVARFANEARAAARIHSDHIMRVSDVGTTPDGISYLVMELLEGEDLGSLLSREGPQPVERCVDWILQVCSGLSDAHSVGVIHRDLKPANLFLARRAGKPPRVKICDFGISKASFEEGGAGITKTNTMLGSPAYMAPEQLRSSRTVDKRADIWSLGVILYELLTGSTPFVGENIGAVFAAILECDPLPVRSMIPTMPEELDDAILRCLRRRADDRFADVGDLAVALEPLAGQSGQTVIRRLSQRPPPSSRALQATTPQLDSELRPVERWGPPSSGHIPAAGKLPSGLENTPSGVELVQHFPTNGGSKRGQTQHLSGATPPPSTRFQSESRLSAPGNSASSVPASPSIQSSADVRSSMDVTPPRQARGKLMVVGALAAMTAVSALVAVSVVHFSKAPPPTATPAVEKESLTISASPREAKISLDDAALTGNPATLSLPRDGTSHHVRAEALGYVTKTQLVTADTALTTVDLSLERSPEPTASAAPSAVTSAFLPLAEVPVSAPRTGKGNAPVTGAHTISTAHTVQPTAAPPTTTTPTAAPPAASTSGIYMDPWKH